jgi:transposase
MAGSTSTRYPREVRERAVRLVFDHQGEYPSQWAAICSIADKSGMTRETLRRWVREAEADSGRRPGISTEGTFPDQGVGAGRSGSYVGLMRS